MILIIAEKPSLGRAIAAVLPKPHQRGDGFVKTGDGYIVSWCIGHLLEQAEPEAYNPAFKKWSHEHLPIVPEQWQLKPKKTVSKQLAVLRKLVKEADEVIHAGDPDREGQLLVDEVIHFLGVKGKKLASVKRCLVNDLNPAAVSRSLGTLRENKEFAPLSKSALARSRADWLYGINMTRAYTLQGRKVGYQGVLSVGRVQTPVLGLVARRDREIENFTSVPYYKVQAHLQTEDEKTFTAEWSPSEACAKFLDEQKRNLSKPLAENVIRRVSFKPATVKKLERKKRQLSAPLPHSLSSLQIDANRVFGLSAQGVLDICQSLYEKHNVITYPRSDCRYLPEAHHREAGKITQCIFDNLQKHGHKQYDSVATLVDPSRKSKTWNDKKVDAHHAIIPTLRKTDRLNPDEVKVYSLVCRNYLAQFLPDHVFFETRADIIIEGGLFIARAKELNIVGWKILFSSQRSAQSKPSSTEKSKEETEQLLPALTEGQTLQSLQAELIERKTSPPAHFTDATLLSAMTGIALYVKDAELKKILRETDGLGTEATRAGIIELLFRREFLQRSGKTIRATDAGHGLVDALPESATLPDRTALWESKLSAISQKEARYQDMMQPLTDELQNLIRLSRETIPTSLRGVTSKKKVWKKSAPGKSKTGKTTPEKTIKGKSGKKPSQRKTSSNRQRKASGESGS